VSAGPTNNDKQERPRQSGKRVLSNNIQAGQDSTLSAVAFSQAHMKTRQAEEATEKPVFVVILSEAKNLSSI